MRLAASDESAGCKYYIFVALAATTEGGTQ